MSNSRYGYTQTCADCAFFKNANTSSIPQCFADPDPRPVREDKPACRFYAREHVSGTFKSNFCLDVDTGAITAFVDRDY